MSGHTVLTGFSCASCGWPLHPALVADGSATHPACDGPLRRYARPAPSSTVPGYCSHGVTLGARCTPCKTESTTQRKEAP